jgi:phospholipase/carboxylesterase
MVSRIELPVREGEHPEIGQEPPQLQFSDLGPEDIRLALKEWAFSTFPNVVEHDTAISVPTSRVLWLDEGVSAAHDDAFMPTPGSREFCHLHEDGSFHAVVDVLVEDEVLKKQWGVRHMYYDRGVKEMLVYAPRNNDELIVAKKIITESYRYASGDIDFVPEL